MKRREFFRAGATTLAAPMLVTLLPRIANAGTPKSQVIGVQHLTVGERKVTAVLDGAIPLGVENFSGLEPEEADTLLEQAFRDPGPVATGVNTYLIHGDDGVALVDAGGAGAFPGLGAMSEALSSANVTSGEISDILLTHMHPDHIGGLLVGGKAAFPNARLHVHEADLAFWTNADIRAQVPEGFQSFFDLAVAVADAYGDKMQTFDADGEVIAGVSSVHLPGHTPGHSGFRVNDDDESLLIWGDIVHVAAFQFPEPSVTIGFDVDAETAAATRSKLFAQVSSSGERVAGMHLDFPGVGHVDTDGDGYRFIPAPYQFDL